MTCLQSAAGSTDNARNCERLIEGFRRSRVQTYQFDVVTESAAMSFDDGHAALVFLAPGGDRG